MINYCRFYVFRLISVAIGLIVLYLAINAYFIRSVTFGDSFVTDGLGRVLTEPPVLAQLLITSEPVWAGLWWHLADIIWFFGGFYLAVKVFEIAGENPNDKVSSVNKI